MKIDWRSYIVAASLLLPSALASDEPQEKWIPSKECINRVIPNFEIEAGKLVLTTPHKGGRFAYQKGDNSAQAADYGEKITTDKDASLKLYEKHSSLEIAPVTDQKGTKFIVIVRSDFRSFGKSLETFVSAFEIKDDSMVALPEIEGRAALEVFQTMEAAKVTTLSLIDLAKKGEEERINEMLFKDPGQQVLRHAATAPNVESYLRGIDKENLRFGPIRQSPQKPDEIMLRIEQPVNLDLDFQIESRNPLRLSLKSIHP